MAIRTIGSLLGASDELKALSARTRRLQELQTLYVRCAPRELAHSSRVKSYRTGTLSISADNAAVAAKLKQLAPTLLASLRKSETEITGVRIEVHVGGAAHERRIESKKSALGADAIQKFDELSKRVPEGELKSALSRLVHRRKERR